MKLRTGSRREFLKKAGLVVGSAALRPQAIFAREISRAGEVSSTAPQSERGADYTLHIKASAVEIAPKRIVSMTTYNGQFPGPLMRFQDGREVTIEIFNDTDTPEQLH